MGVIKFIKIHKMYKGFYVNYGTQCDIQTLALSPTLLPRNRNTTFSFVGNFQSLVSDENYNKLSRCLGRYSYQEITP